MDLGCTVSRRGSRTLITRDGGNQGLRVGAAQIHAGEPTRWIREVQDLIYLLPELRRAAVQVEGLSNAGSICAVSTAIGHPGNCPGAEVYRHVGALAAQEYAKGKLAVR